MESPDLPRRDIRIIAAILIVGTASAAYWTGGLAQIVVHNASYAAIFIAGMALFYETSWPEKRRRNLLMVITLLAAAVGITT